MKTVPAKKLTDFLFVVLLGAATACSPPEARDLDRAKSQAEHGRFQDALTGFDRVIKRAPESPSSVEAAREGARIAIFELKDYKKAATYFQHIVLSSTDAVEREQAQRSLASLYFEHLQDYPRAIVEYNRLLAMNPPFADRVRDQLTIARANFYQGNLEQAQSEVTDLLKEKLLEEAKFEAMILKGNILVAKKLFTEAAETYKSLMKEFPARSAQENVGIQLAVCYEESQDFKQAVVVLEGIRSTYKPQEYIELRIKRLQERARNQPGAKGMGRK